MDRNFKRSTQRIEITENGIIFRKGKMYSYERKLEIANHYNNLLHLYCEHPLLNKYPTISAVAKSASCGRNYAKKVIDEINTVGSVIDPEIIKHNYLNKRKVNLKLSVQQQICILSLHSESPNRPNCSYVEELNIQFGIEICSKTITNFFNSKYFKQKGTFDVPNNLPLDKFKIILFGTPKVPLYLKYLELKKLVIVFSQISIPN